MDPLETSDLGWRYIVTMRFYFAAVRTVGLLGVLALLSCGGDDAVMPEATPLSIPDGCNPLVSAVDCLLPYPSDFFLAPGANTPSGSEVVIPPAAQVIVDGEPVDLLSPHRPDGFSPAGPIIAHFGLSLSDDNLVFHTDDVTQTERGEGPTVLLHAETGKPVLHFAELDPRPFEDNERALIIRPLVRLEPGARYVVALRELKDKDGAMVAAPAGFRSLRDDAGRAHPTLAAASDHYENEVFPIIEAAGLNRNELQLAWDFTVASEESLTLDLLAMRQDALERLDAAQPKITVVKVIENPNSNIGRQIEMTVEVPLYLESDEPGAALARDKEGHVSANGTVDVPFSVIIPPSVLSGDKAPARLLQYGHGFFGSREEATGYAAGFAEDNGFVIVAADWWGMSEADQGSLADTIIGDAKETGRFTDRVHQAMINLLYVASTARGPLLSLDEVQVNAQPAYDPSELYFYGISAGHILGGTYLALNPDIERAALSVGGANVGMMMFRAGPFVAFLAIIGLVVPEPLAQQKFAMLLQATVDRIDPLTYAPMLLERPLDDFDGSARAPLHVLMHTGIGDPAVPNMASHLHARTLGLSMLEPRTREIVGIPGVEGPVDGSAIVEFDFGVELPSVVAIPSLDDNGVHEGVRRLAVAKQQIDRFFRSDGVIEVVCDGVCDPE